MQHMTDIYTQLVSLKKEKMEIEFTPISAREKNFVKKLRELKKNIAKLSIQLHDMRRGGK